jgi:hypothetical protein
MRLTCGEQGRKEERRKPTLKHGGKYGQLLEEAGNPASLKPPTKP